VYNKIDTVSIEDIDALVRQPNSTVISSGMRLGLNLLKERIWDMLGLVRVYTKKKGCPPDLHDPLILTKGRGGFTIKVSFSLNTIKNTVIVDKFYFLITINGLSNHLVH
jgi:ribosome-interacting GTPase 1